MPEPRTSHESTRPRRPRVAISMFRRCQLCIDHRRGAFRHQVFVKIEPRVLARKRNRPSFPCIRDDEGLTIELSRFQSKMPRPSRRAFRFTNPFYLEPRKLSEWHTNENCDPVDLTA